MKWIFHQQRAGSGFWLRRQADHNVMEIYSVLSLCPNYRFVRLTDDDNLLTIRAGYHEV